MEDWLYARHRVRSYELDSFGHVNNAIFMNYLEYARNEYLLQKGLTFAQFDQWQAYPVVVRAEIDYRRPAKIHDELVIQGRISDWKRSSFEMEYKVILAGQEELILKAKMVFVFVDAQGRPMAIPGLFRRKMDAF